MALWRHWGRPFLMRVVSCVHRAEIPGDLRRPTGISTETRFLSGRIRLLELFFFFKKEEVH